MRIIPPALQTKLNSGVTTLCRCWVIRRVDGVTQGFTDHDEDVALGDTVCRVGSGMSGSEATQKLGFATDSSEIAGALADDSLNEADLAAGRYDTYGVNSGIGRSGRVLRRILMLSDDSSVVTDAVIAAAHSTDAGSLVAAICDERLWFLKSLRTWPVFGAGWGRRVSEVKSAALTMAVNAVNS